MTSLLNDNRILKELINREEPFLISRLGIGAEPIVSYLVSQNRPIPPLWVNRLRNPEGIYNLNTQNARRYSNEYFEAVKNSTYLAAWDKCDITPIQDALIHQFSLDTMCTRILEPFYVSLQNNTPWSQSLKGKKVLIVNPFVKSMKSQWESNFTLFDDPALQLFSKEQEFVWYKPYQCLQDNPPHSSWEETLDSMCEEISKLDFDIALVACGGYGLPMCNYIYTKLNRSAIYVGGGLQLLFGVIGKRWDNREIWVNFKKTRKLIRPSGDEIIDNFYKNVEGGSYW